jgi:hypothetical protein
VCGEQVVCAAALASWGVALHGGAAQGYLSAKQQKKYESIMVEACRRASELLDAGGSAVDAVKLAVEVLEDDATTNAGFGSNLTLDGTVEVFMRPRAPSEKCAPTLRGCIRKPKANFFCCPSAMQASCAARTWPLERSQRRLP